MEEQEKEVKPVPYSEEEKQYRSYLLKRLTNAQKERDRSHPEFDDMTYLENYEANKKADNSYIPAKRNREDTRITSGITREKDNTLLSTLLSYNFEPDVTGFDEENYVVAQLGETTEDMTRKSRQMESYNDKRPLIYGELLIQGTVFVEELWSERYTPQKTGSGWDPTKPPKTFWSERIKQTYARAEANLLPGKQVYLGNVREINIDKQPYLFTYDIIDYAEAKAIYGQWERFQYVPKHVQRTFVPGSTTTYDRWSLLTVPGNKVEVIKYQDPYKNDYMIVLNGVMMLAPGFPLTEISPSGSFTIAKGDLEPRAGFAYSKGIPTKTKVDQQTIDQFIKLAIQKTEQSFKPPMGNTSRKIISRRALLPAQITTDLQDGQLFPLVQTGGLTGGEFSFYNLMKESIDSKSANALYSGETPSGTQTATEILELKKQQILKLGLSVDGVVSLETQLSWRRIQTILHYWTQPVESKMDEYRENMVHVYRSITVDSTFENGRKGMKTIRFADEPDKTPEELHRQEEMSEDEVREVIVSPKALKAYRGYWYIKIVPTEKNSDSLTRLLFLQNLSEALQIFGPESVNLDYLKERYATIIGEDPTKYFRDANVVDNLLAGQLGEGGVSQQPTSLPKSNQAGIQARNSGNRIQAVLNQK